MRTIDATIDATPNAPARRIGPVALALAGLAMALAAGGVILAGPRSPSGTGAKGTVVSQRGRAFSPSVVTLAAGGSLTVFNDDGRNTHHVYVDSEKLRFDSSDQEPGDSAVIPFPDAGTFQVLCGIHPKMRMTVLVK